MRSLTTASLLAATLLTACSADRSIGAEPGRAADTTAHDSVHPRNVRGIRVEPSPVAVTAGADAPLVASLLLSTGSAVVTTRVGWRVVDTAIARMSPAGVLHGIRAGSTTVVATAAEQSVTVPILVSATPVASVRLEAPRQTLLIGETLRMAATAFDANGAALAGRSVTWSSADDAVVRVDASGTLTARGSGSALVTATSEGRSASLVFTVSPVPVRAVVFTRTVASLFPGDVAQLAAEPRDSIGAWLPGRTVAWTSSAPGVASVTLNGLVEAYVPGVTTITARIEDRTASVQITVTPRPAAAVAAVAITPATASIIAGAGTSLVAEPRDVQGNALSGRVVTWSSDAIGVATVTASGAVLGIAPGTARISATSEGVTAVATITVTPRPVTTVTVGAPSSTLGAGEGMQLQVTLRDATGATLTGRVVAWRSSASVVASVSANGFVTGVNAGVVTISAESESVTGSVTLTVTPPPPPTTGSWEPAGMTRVTERAFTATVEDGWLGPNENFAIVNDAHAPHSGPSVAQVTYPAGFGGGTQPSVLERTFGTPHETLYTSFWVRLSPNFVGHPGSGVNKILHFWIHGFNRVYLSAQGTSGGVLQPQVRLQQIPSHGGARNLVPNLVPTAEIVRGRWQRWELLVRSNVNGQPNGLVEWWIDGVKVGSYSDVTLVTGTERRTWELLQWAPTWGGMGGTVPAAQFMWIDHLYVSGR